MAGEFVEQAFERLALRLGQSGKHVALGLAQRRNVLRIERAAGRCDEQNLAPVVGAVGFAAQQLFLLERDDAVSDLRLRPSQSGCWLDRRSQDHPPQVGQADRGRLLVEVAVSLTAELSGLRLRRDSCSPSAASERS